MNKNIKNRNCQKFRHKNFHSVFLLLAINNLSFGMLCNVYCIIYNIPKNICIWYLVHDVYMMFVTYINKNILWRSTSFFCTVYNSIQESRYRMLPSKYCTDWIRMRSLSLSLACSQFLPIVLWPKFDISINCAVLTGHELICSALASIIVHRA